MRYLNKRNITGHALDNWNDKMINNFKKNIITKKTMKPF